MLDFFSVHFFLNQERALAVTELGSALKFETDEPHFVSLGGGFESCDLERETMINQK